MTLKIGALVPNGWTGEYDGWDPSRAWERTVHVAQQAEALGFDSIWMWDHFHRIVLSQGPAGDSGTLPSTVDEMTFEVNTSLSALAMATRRVKIGQIVTCNGFRSPALLAKMAATMDMISGGRMVLGIGAGWKKEEWLAYGYGFPETRIRLAMLGEALEVITRMLEPGRTNRARFKGSYYSVDGAINLPKPIQRPRVPIMVGGNGPNVTWRLAAKHADEVNLDGMLPAETREALPVIRRRCEEIGRDPATLPVSCHVFWGDLAKAGQQRVDLLGAYRDLGVARVMGLLQESAKTDEALESLAEDAVAAGVTLEP